MVLSDIVPSNELVLSTIHDATAGRDPSQDVQGPITWRSCELYVLVCVDVLCDLASFILCFHISVWILSMVAISWKLIAI